MQLNCFKRLMKEKLNQGLHLLARLSAPPPFYLLLLENLLPTCFGDTALLIPCHRYLCRCPDDCHDIKCVQCTFELQLQMNLQQSSDYPEDETPQFIVTVNVSFYLSSWPILFESQPINAFMQTSTKDLSPNVRTSSLLDDLNAHSSKASAPCYSPLSDVNMVYAQLTRCRQSTLTPVEK